MNAILIPSHTTARVSVIIPAYNAAGTIRRAINSVLAQMTPAAEVIVIDDGSTDDLASALADYDNSVTLIRTSNGGAASARNVGIERATGEFIAFLDADDYWEPQKLERQLNIFALHPEVGLVAGQAYAQVPGGERNVSLVLEHGQFDRVLCLKGEAAFRAANGVWTGTVLMRREALGDDRFLFGLETAEDRDLWVRIVARSPIYFVSESLATAVLEANSLSRSCVARDCGNMLRVVRRHRRLLGRVGTLLWVSHTHYRWAACEPRTVPRMLRLLLSLLLWPFPYSIQLEPIRYARTKQFIVNLLRLLGLWRPHADCESPAAAAELMESNTA